MLNEKLKHLRTEYEITADRLAQFMKVSKQDILDWEEGRKEPSLTQIHELANLFDVAYDELLCEKDNNKQNKDQTSSAKVKGKQKHKTKKKTKTKHKTKKVNNKTVEKKRNWPLLIILMILLVAIALGGYLYWKYGDEYFLSKKNDYEIEELVGTFGDEASYENSSAVLVLASDGSYTLEYHDCSVETQSNGSWSVEGNRITLKDSSAKEHTFKVYSDNKLKLTSSDIGCSIKKQDVFTRGVITSNKEEQIPDTEESTPVETSTSYIKIGQWSGNNSTLRVDEVGDKQVLFTLTSYDPEDASNVATISDIKGDIDSNTVTFTYTDDGYGNAGEGSMVFDKTSVIFHISETTVNEEAQWSLLKSGTLQ